MSTIAATSTRSYLSAHGAGVASGAALDHGFQTAFYALTGLLIVGAALAVTFVRSTPLRRQHAEERVEGDTLALEDAA